MQLIKHSVQKYIDKKRENITTTAYTLEFLTGSSLSRIVLKQQLSVGLLYASSGSKQ